MTKDEGTNGGVEGEAEDAVAGGVNKNGGWPVNDIASRHLFRAGLEDSGANVVADTWGLAKDGEDSANVDVHVDVGGAIEGVEDDNVFAGGRGTVEDKGFLIFFGDEGGDAIAKPRQWSRA